MDTVQDGLAAARILEDPVFQRAVAMADERFVALWRQADTPEARERAHALQAALGQIVNELEVLVGRGEFETRVR